MTVEVEVTPELQARIDAIAARSCMSRSQIIADALQYGRSLRWQERFLDKVAAGIAAADRGEFATTADIERVLSKYRPRLAR
jgi:predicted transcriptional regulator